MNQFFYKYFIIVLIFSHVEIFSQQKYLVEIPYLNNPPNVDADINDWDLLNPIIFYTDTIPGFKNTINVFLGWDEQYLYFMMKVEDKHLNYVMDGEKSNSIYFNDAIELYLDSKNDSKNRMDINDYQFIIDLAGNSVVLKGDKYFIMQPYDLAPKDPTVANITFEKAVTRLGTTNDNNDIDSFFIVEAAIDWATIGIRAKQGLKFKLDICNDDIDSLVNLSNVKEGESIKGFTFISWSGSKDFSYPNEWTEVMLVGSPNLLTKLSKKYPKEWLILFTLTLLISFFVIYYLFRKVNYLKKIPVKETIEKTILSDIILSKKVDEKEDIEIFRKAKAFIDKNIEKNISPEELSKYLAISLRQLERVFKAELNTTPNNFIILNKLERAASLLKDGDMNITEVAFEVGFNDSSYFSKVFKKYFNISPKEFQKKYSLS